MHKSGAYFPYFWGLLQFGKSSNFAFGKKFNV